MGAAVQNRHAALSHIARNAGVRSFAQAHGFRAAATSDGVGTEEGEPDILFVRDGAAPVITRNQAGAAPP